MQKLRLFVCTFLLAGTVVAQTAGSSSSSSNTNGAPQDPNQPLQSPLQEPVKTDPLDQRKQQQKSDFNVSETSTSGQDQFLGELKLMIRNTELGGGFQQRSFLSPGENLLGESNIYSDQRFLGGHRFQMLTMYRGTNDRSIDPEQNSLQKAYVRIYGKSDEYVFGDVLVNYSRLAFNQNIKGASLVWKLGSRWKLSTVAGIYTDRWGSLYHSYAEYPSRPYTATVAGGRLEYQLAKRTTIGWNFSSYTDQLSSIPQTPLVAGVTPTSPFPANNRIGSIDWKTAVGGLRFNGEISESATVFDKRLSSDYQTDFGGFAEATYRYKRFSVRSSMVRYEPNFASFNARQISDLQDWVTRASFELTSWLTIDGTGRRSNNNLKGQSDFETVSWGPEGRLIFHDMPFYKRMVFETGYRERLTYNANLNSANCSALATATNDPTTCRADRGVRMPFAEITLPVKTTFFSIGVERQQVIDQVHPSQSTTGNRVYASFRGIYDLGGWHFNPVFRYEFQRTSQRPELENLIDRLDYDNNRLGTASLYIETPKYFVMELAFRDASSTLVSYIPDPSVLNGPQVFAPAGYSRPQYKAALTYKFRNDENTLLVFSFERNSNFYYAPSPNYDERVYGVSIIYKFGKRRK
jgi:hypothetical protein